MKHAIHPTARALGLVACLLVLGLTAAAPALAQGSSYKEGFDTGSAPGWKLSEAWQVSKGVLLGRGAGDALYAESQWDDMRFTTVIRSLAGTVNIRFHDDGGSQRYAVRLTALSDTLVVDLVRQVAGQDDLILGSSKIPLDQGQLAAPGLIIEVDFDHGALTVSHNNAVIINAADPDALPGGLIGFDTLEGSLMEIDEVTVEPIEVATGPPGQGGFDLLVAGVRVDRFERGSVIVILSVDVANLGASESPAFEIAVSDEQDGVSNNVIVSPLAGGDKRTVTLALEGPDAWQQTDRRFVAEIDPGGVIDDANRDNNRLVSEVVSVPDLSGATPGQPAPATVAPPSNQPAGFSPLLIGGLAVVLVGFSAVATATALAVRQQMKIGQRRQWEAQAQPGQPPDRCAPPGIYVGVEPSMNLKPMRITHLELKATDTGRDTVRRKQAFKGGVTNTLRLAILAHWLRDPRQTNAARIAELSSDIGKPLTDFFLKESGRCDLSVSAHLEGIEVKATFTLYRCEMRGGASVWKKVESWDKSKTQERDDVIALLDNRDPAATLATGGLKAELEPYIRQYIEKF